MSSAPGPSLCVEAARARLVKLQRGPAVATVIPAKAPRADGDSMDTSMDICDTLGSNTEAASDLIGPRRNTQSDQVKGFIRP